MNPSTRNKVIYSAAITTGLLLLFFFPVMIWSPPWGQDGYYIPESGKHVGHCHVKDNNLNYHLFDEQMGYLTGTMEAKKGLGGGGGRKARYSSVTGSVSQQYSFSYIYYFDLSMYITNHKTKERMKLAKTSNPITLWHLLWLEWTA